jgi:hypothetical protein
VKQIFTLQRIPLSFGRATSRTNKTNLPGWWEREPGLHAYRVASSVPSCKLPICLPRMYGKVSPDAIFVFLDLRHQANQRAKAPAPVFKLPMKNRFRPDGVLKSRPLQLSYRYLWSPFEAKAGYFPWIPESWTLFRTPSLNAGQHNKKSLGRGSRHYAIA